MPNMMGIEILPGEAVRVPLRAICIAGLMAKRGLSPRQRANVPFLVPSFPGRADSGAAALANSV